MSLAKRGALLLVGVVLGFGASFVVKPIHAQTPGDTSNIRLQYRATVDLNGSLGVFLADTRGSGCYLVVNSKDGGVSAIAQAPGSACDVK
ncbi:MAG TPA: hypothetical protein VJN96_22565 [Vicinamibacterales bacterium]|nr:hypothetical protein [Vicinamibacterales bacterium]